MSRVPAGVIPGVTPVPDPERRLKKSQRSTIGQGKKRKGISGGGGATQGSASVDSPVTQISHLSKAGGGKGRKKR
jgi:signal recognition particle subunit SRP72